MKFKIGPTDDNFPTTIAKKDYRKFQVTISLDKRGYNTLNSNLKSVIIYELKTRSTTKL